MKILKRIKKNAQNVGNKFASATKMECVKSAGAKIASVERTKNAHAEEIATVAVTMEGVKVSMDEMNPTPVGQPQPAAQPAQPAQAPAGMPGEQPMEAPAMQQDETQASTESGGGLMGMLKKLFGK